MVQKIGIPILLVIILFLMVVSSIFADAAKVMGTAKVASYQIAALYAQQNSAQTKQDLAHSHGPYIKAGPHGSYLVAGSTHGPYLKVLNIQVGMDIISVSLDEQKSYGAVGVVYLHTPRRDTWVRDGKRWQCKSIQRGQTAEIIH